LFRAFVLEKPRGLDFHLRNKSLKTKSGGKSQGYAITPESHVREIFAAVQPSEQNSFIDIGCGKGYVLTKAASRPYRRVTGIDIVPDLIRIAKKNISILKLENRIELCLADAAAFNYDGSDHFFLYNPFSPDILQMVVKAIIESLDKTPRDITVIYFHPSGHRVFMDTGRFVLTRTLHCFIKDYKTYIYRNIA
jgi:16S rRNA G966 N2-methylase RsmD